MKSTKLLFIAFLLSLTFSFINCTKDNNITSTTQEALIHSNWGVDFYFNNQNLTGNYGSYRILFSNTGLLVAQKNNETTTGNWSNSVDANNNEQVSLNFNTADTNLVQLNRQWKVVNRTPATIEFEGPDNISPAEALRIRKQ